MSTPVSCPVADRAREIVRLYAIADRIDLDNRAADRETEKERRQRNKDAMAHVVAHIDALKELSSFEVPTSAAGAALQVQLLAELADQGEMGSPQRTDAERTAIQASIWRRAWAVQHYLRAFAAIEPDADTSRAFLIPDPFERLPEAD